MEKYLNLAKQNPVFIILALLFVGVITFLIYREYVKNVNKNESEDEAFNMMGQQSEEQANQQYTISIISIVFASLLCFICMCFLFAGGGLYFIVEKSRPG